MAKVDKLGQYRAKEYKETVVFPVEILGRDGVVRQYNYRASLELYRRRMRTAQARLQDADLAAAERSHCSSRIAQIKRSYLETYGWTGSEYGPETAHPNIAAEIAAFLVRALRASGRLNVTFTELTEEPDGAKLWYLHQPGNVPPLFLYVYDLTGDRHPESVGAAYLQRVRELSSLVASSGPAERLLNHFSDEECGLVLTGRSDEVEEHAAAIMDEGVEAAGPTPWDELHELVIRSDYPTAFLRARWVCRNHPWHRDAYAAAAMLGIVLRRAIDAEGMAFQGVGYLPDDGLLHYYLGLSRIHQGRNREAQAALEIAVAKQPSLAVARSLLILSYLTTLRWVRLPRLLKHQGGGLPVDEAELDQVVRLSKRVMVLGALVPLAALLAVASLSKVQEYALPMLMAIVVMCILSAMLLHHRVDHALERLIDEDPKQALQRIAYRG